MLHRLWGVRSSRDQDYNLAFKNVKDSLNCGTVLSPALCFLFFSGTRNSPSEKRMMADHTAQKPVFDALYCEEQKWAEHDQEDDSKESQITSIKNDLNARSNLSLWAWDDEELQSLLCKEKQTCLKPNATVIGTDLSLTLARKEAVEWILKINAYHGFSSLTAILAVNYLDRFLSTRLNFRDKPWLMQLAAVTCLSLAAKVEEIHVPLLLDLQVEDTKWLFEAETIQRMELLVLTSLKWRMNPVTPLSFVDLVTRRLGLKNIAHWKFLRSCENVILSVIADSRFVGYLPSVLATATMLHVVRHFEPCSGVEYANQLLGVLKISKEEVNDCHELIVDTLSKTGLQGHSTGPPKRSPSGLMEALLGPDKRFRNIVVVVTVIIFVVVVVEFFFVPPARFQEEKGSRTADETSVVINEWKSFRGRCW